MLLNLTNQPSSRWSSKKRQEAERRWGKVCDVPFPDVPPEWDAAKVQWEAQEFATVVTSYTPDAVLVQGEMTMTYALVREFKKRGVPTFAATSKRDFVEVPQPDGNTRKLTVFRFAGFRPYC